MLLEISLLFGDLLFESTFISRISCWQTLDQVLVIYYYNTANI